MKAALFSFLLICLFTSGVGAKKNNASALCLRARNLHKRGFPHASFSGIAVLGDGKYALVSDRQTGCWWETTLKQHHRTGQLLGCWYHGLRKAEPCENVNSSVRVPTDAEGIAYDSLSHTLYISYEGDQSIRAYAVKTLKEIGNVPVPALCRAEAIYPNYGFEALAWDGRRHCLWTCTENALRRDALPPVATQPKAAWLRLLSIPTKTDSRTTAYAYCTEVPKGANSGRAYAFGVSAIAVLPTGELLVLEREFHVAKMGWGSWVQNKLFLVNPAPEYVLPSLDAPLTVCAERQLPKQAIAAWRTHFGAFNTRLANYEGMCTGIRRADGRLTLLLVSDAQEGAGKGFYTLKDYIRVIVLPEAF